MKKYSDKYLNNYQELSKAVLGFELECFFDNISFYKVLELLNKELDPVEVHGFRTYHSDFVVDANNFKIERDISGGQNMCEIITGPLDYYTAKYFLIKILRFIKDHGYTTNKSSLHINLSFTDKDLSKLNIVKQIISTDEDDIYKRFPSRENNVYAKSVKNIIPFKDYSYSDISPVSVGNILQIPENKYYGINFQNIFEKNGRLEFRYIGGEDYEKQIGDILELMDKFIIETYSNIGSSLTDENVEDLETFLNKRINSFKNISSYDNFLVEYPNIELQINQDNRYEMVSAHYSKIYERIFDLLESIEDIEEGIINYYVGTNKLEVVGANFTVVSDLHNIDFIKCRIYNGIIYNSNIFDSRIVDAEINRSKLDRCDVKNGKLISCNVEKSDLENVYFQAGLLNSNMEGGIFRSGKLGPYANISEETLIVGQEKDFFNTKKDDEEDDKSKIKKY